MSMSSTMASINPLIEIEANNWPRLADDRTLAFSADGEHLLNGTADGVQMCRVKDGERIANLRIGTGTFDIRCLAVSNDGRWIAGGGSVNSSSGWRSEVCVWDRHGTLERVFNTGDRNHPEVPAVDFSPDSTRLIVVTSFVKNNFSAVTVWDLATGKQIRTLSYEDRACAAKYSPQGDLIAMATAQAIRIRDSNNGRSLVDVDVKVTVRNNKVLAWFNHHLFFVSDGEINQIDVSTGLTVSKWPVPDSGEHLCIAIPKNGKFVAYATSHTLAIWHMPTHTLLRLIEYPQRDVEDLAVSPDGQLIAIGRRHSKKIDVHSVPCIIDSIPPSHLHPTFQEPVIQIDDDALDSWKCSQFANADALLTIAITKSQNKAHHFFACRALVRARLQQWDAAIADVTESLRIQPSFIGHIARSVALVGKGEKLKALRACDIAFESFHSTHATFLLLVKAIIVFMAGEHDDAISRVDDLIETVYYNTICYAVQAYMHLLIGNSLMKNGNHEGAIQSFRYGCAKMRPHSSPTLSTISLISGWKFEDFDITIRQRLCEALYAVGRIKEASESLLAIVNTFNDKVYVAEPVSTWILEFMHRCLMKPENGNDTELYSLIPSPLLREWVRLQLIGDSWNNALVYTLDFTAPRFAIYQAFCDCLESLDKIVLAAECFHQMIHELNEKSVQDTEWVLNFRKRLSNKLEVLGDAAVESKKIRKAISHYSAALSLDPAEPSGLFIKRSRACTDLGLWEDALTDANKVIMIDPSSPWGFERKHSALLGAGRYDDAVDALEMMFAATSDSSDLEALVRSTEYTSPDQTRAAIHAAIDNAIRDTPLVLINTDSGRLLDKAAQASLFDSQPIFQELVASMTTHIDHPRIEHEVTQYYRYATFSHKWEDKEPLFDQVIRIAVYDLEGSLTHDKLQMFCKIVRESGFHWAWSDTCCINKGDHFVLQEALVAMFKWYEGSGATIVLLRGVRSPSKRGDLVRSIWNTRAWTLQEYHASKVVRFYTEDWKPYLDLDIPNHKEAPEIIAEMEEATRVSARALMALRPGLNDVREKLRLASTRQTTRVEDAAYSLLGIFSMSLPVVYGEGDKALGRFLAQLVMSSGDTSVLAWTGRSGSFNSCLPMDIAVFNQLPTTHVPHALEHSETDNVIASLRSSSLSSSSIVRLYDRLFDLPVPSFAGQRMKLPCLCFKLGPLLTSGRVFRAQTVIGAVEVRTEEELSRFGSLYLVHPWIDFLLDRQPVGKVVEVIPEEGVDDRTPGIGEVPSFSSSSGMTLAAPQTRAGRLMARLGRPFGGSSRGTKSLLLPPSSMSRTETQMRALQVIARLRQPFGALLLTPHLGTAYRRVAAESLISVQVEEITPVMLNKLVECVRTLDVL